MKIGITATRKGMTDPQLEALERILERLKPEELHHGDCIGGDEDAHRIAQKLRIRVVGHPPTNTSAQAHCLCDRSCAPLPYLERDYKIVEDTDALIALPKGFEEETRGSGTWATYRYAKLKKKPVVLIWPSGNVEGPEL